MSFRSRRERGSGLIISLSVLAMLAIMATTFITLMRLDIRVARNYADDQRCEMLAYGMMNYFRSVLRDDLDRTWRKYENRDTGVGYIIWSGSTSASVCAPGLYGYVTLQPVESNEKLGTPVSNDFWISAPYTDWGDPTGNLYVGSSGVPQQSFAWNRGSSTFGVVSRLYVERHGQTGGSQCDLWVERGRNCRDGDGQEWDIDHVPPGVPVADIDDDGDGAPNPSTGDGHTSENRYATLNMYYDVPLLVIYSGPTYYHPGSRMTGERMLPSGVYWRWGVKVGPSHSMYANLNVHGNLDGTDGGWLANMGGVSGLVARQADDERNTNPNIPAVHCDHLARIEWKGFSSEYEYQAHGGFPARYNNVMYAPAAANLEKLFRRHEYVGWTENPGWIQDGNETPNVGVDRELARQLIRYRWRGGSGGGKPADGSGQWRVGWRRDGATYFKFPSPENPLGNDRYFGANEVLEHDHSVDHPGTSAVADILGEVPWRKLRPHVTMWSTDTILRGKIWPNEGWLPWRTNGTPGDWRHIDILKRVNVNIIGAKGPDGMGNGALKSAWADKRLREQTRLYYMLINALSFTDTPDFRRKACQFIASLTDMVDRDQNETYYEAPDNPAIWALGVEKHPVINEVVVFLRNATTPNYERFRFRVELYNPMENIPWIPDSDEAYDISDYILEIRPSLTGTSHRYPLSETYMVRYTDDPNTVHPHGMVIGAEGMFADPNDTSVDADTGRPRTWNRFAHLGWNYPAGEDPGWPRGVSREEMNGLVDILLWKPLTGAAAGIADDGNKVTTIDGGKYICVDRTMPIRLVKWFDPAGPGGPGDAKGKYLGIYRRWDPMNARVYGTAGTDEQSNVLWCTGWAITNYPTLGRPNTGYPAGAASKPPVQWNGAISPYQYDRRLERNFKIVDGDLPSIGWLGELMMTSCADPDPERKGPLTLIHAEDHAQQPPQPGYHKYKWMSELDTKGKFDLFRPFWPAEEYEPTGPDMHSENLHVLDMFTIWDPSNDGIDNDGDGAIDDADTGCQAGDKCGPEVRVFGKLDINQISENVMTMAWPDGKYLRDEGMVLWPINRITGSGRSSHRTVGAINANNEWDHNYGRWGPFETIADFIRADVIVPFPASLLSGSSWYTNWPSGTQRLSEHGAHGYNVDEANREDNWDLGDDDGDGISDERDERDMVFTWIANHYTTRANVFEVDISVDICQPPYYPEKDGQPMEQPLPYTAYKTRRSYARKQLLGILDRSTTLRIREDGACDFTGPVDVRMLRMTDDLRVY